MSVPIVLRRAWLVPLLLALALIVGWQIVFAQAPEPHPISAAEVNLNPGPAATIHGDPLKGRKIFAASCAVCHGDRGTGNMPNPGSDDGTVPPVNPIDPGFLDDSKGDPAMLARDIDLFVQHGSLPEGDSPALTMPGWGDQKLLPQEQLADVEAYVMQLNGVYWPDKWYPPAEVQMTATRSGNQIVYSINILNHGSSTLSNVQLRDTLPAGLAYVKSEYYGLGNNPAKVEGSTVEWMVGGVPQGGAAGPFIITTGLTGTTVPPNTAQVVFDFCMFSGTCLPASQISDAVLPSAPAKPAAAAPVNTPAPVAAAATTAATETSAATTAAPVTETPATTETEAAAATATEAPATPTTAPTAAPAVQVPRPSGGNLTGGDALNLQGDAASGQQLLSKCQACHGPDGKGGIANPGATASMVPALNPVDPAFKSSDAKTFAYNLDLYIEHGSKPQGDNPTLTMPAWGDLHILTPQQIANILAYIISVNP